MISVMLVCFDETEITFKSGARNISQVRCHLHPRIFCGSHHEPASQQGTSLWRYLRVGKSNIMDTYPDDLYPVFCDGLLCST